MDRRSFVLGASTLAAATAHGIPAKEPTEDGWSLDARQPRFEFVYECDVTIAETLQFGATAEGQRRIIPITGGRFRGPKMRGVVLPIGADWNLLRGDNSGSAEAAYYIKTDDGVYIRVVNTGRGNGSPPTTERNGEHFFMFTTPVFEAPIGKYEWLNRTTFVATLGARHEVRNAVLIRVFQVV